MNSSIGFFVEKNDARTSFPLGFQTPHRVPELLETNSKSPMKNRQSLPKGNEKVFQPSIFQG